MDSDVSTPGVDLSTYTYDVFPEDNVTGQASVAMEGDLLLGITWAFLGIMRVLSNAAVLGVLFQKKHRKEVANLYLVNLAIGDILVSCSVPVHVIENNNLAVWTSELCVINVVLKYLPLFITVNTIMLIAIERFVAIVLPTRFRQFAAARSVRLQLAAAWILAFIELGYVMNCVSARISGTATKCLRYDGASCFFYMSVLIIAVPSIFLVVIYGCIGVIVLSRARKLHPADVADSSGPVAAQSSSQHQQAQEKQPPQKQKQQQKHAAGRERRVIRLAITCAVVTVLFLLCWMPIFLITLIFMYVLKVLTAWATWMNIAQTLVYIHSSMNPAVYFCVDVRFKSILVRLFCRRDVAEVSTAAASSMQPQVNDKNEAGQCGD